MQRSFFNVAMLFFACCSAALGKNHIRTGSTAEKQMLQCNSCSTTFWKLQGNFRYRLCHVATLQGWGLEGWGLGLAEMGGGISVGSLRLTLPFRAWAQIISVRIRTHIMSQGFCSKGFVNPPSTEQQMWVNPSATSLPLLTTMGAGMITQLTPQQLLLCNWCACNWILIPRALLLCNWLSVI